MIEDLNVPIELRVVPTVREPDGLAMSSRNRYLDPTQRHNATCLIRALRRPRTSWHAANATTAALEHAMAELIAATPGAVLDYAEVRDANTLESIDTLAIAGPRRGGSLFRQNAADR